MNANSHPLAYGSSSTSDKSKKKKYKTCRLQDLRRLSEHMSLAKNALPIHKSNTSVICPLSEELIVLSMFALKFHLKIDIKELSFTNSKSGKDLPKESYHQYQLFQTLLMLAEHAIITRVREKFLSKPLELHDTSKEWLVSHNCRYYFVNYSTEVSTKAKKKRHLPDFNYTSLKQQDQSANFFIFL